ncbi:radical SAM protein [bacterium]|nr:radical SAM protein [bacterium]
MTNTFLTNLVEMKELNNLFIELTAKNCNQHCKQCYINFPISKNVKDFISVDKIKEALWQTKSEAVKCIYLTGAEPMTHPDFNSILRLCLEYNNTCICTNASFINEKKARFLKKVEDEGENEIIFMLSFAHYNEIKNDDIRVRGAYRQTINAIKALSKYGFNPILNISNFYNESESVILSEMQSLCQKLNVETGKINFIINKAHNVNTNESWDINFDPKSRTDCKSGRILTEKGIYVCPFLANDHRGRMGNDFTDYSKKMYLETEYCKTCCSNKHQMFSIDFNS